MLPSQRFRAEAEQEALHSMDPDHYLNTMGIRHYLHDVLTILAESREQKPVEALRGYFAAAVKGTHVLHRPSHFIFSTMHNRCSFALCYQSSILRFLSNKSVDGALTVQEYLQVAHLLCDDFPPALIESVHRYLQPDSESNVTGRLFAKGFLVFLFYKEFLEDVAAIMLKSPVSPSAIIAETFTLLRSMTTVTQSWRPSRATTTSLPSQSTSAWQVPKDFVVQVPPAEVLHAMFQQKGFTDPAVPINMASLLLGMVDSPSILQHIVSSDPALFANWKLE